MYVSIFILTKIFMDALLTNNLVIIETHIGLNQLKNNR